MTGVPCVVTWFSGCKHLLGCDIAFPCRDSVLLFYIDNVGTEVSLSRPRRPRQEVSCCTLHVMTGFGQEVKFLCRERVFYVATEFGWDQGFLCCDMVVFMSRQGSALTRVFLVAIENSL